MFIFAKNPSSLPQCLSICRHNNEGIPSTDHVQMLHWACADIIMRGNPVTDMTDNAETQTQTDSVYTLTVESSNVIRIIKTLTFHAGQLNPFFHACKDLVNGVYPKYLPLQ